MPDSFIAAYKAEAIAQYHDLKQIADQALSRVDDQAFFKRLAAGGDDHTNSVAILVKHLGGNLRSRWTDFLTTDGEKPNRLREREFQAEDGESRAQIIAQWERGWQILFATLEALQEEDFARTITIRGEPHTVVRAIHRNLVHAAQHVGQLDLLGTLLHETSR